MGRELVNNLLIYLANSMAGMCRSETFYRTYLRYDECPLLTIVAIRLICKAAYRWTFHVLNMKALTPRSHIRVQNTTLLFLKILIFKNNLVFMRLELGLYQHIGTQPEFRGLGVPF